MSKTWKDRDSYRAGKWGKGKRNNRRGLGSDRRGDNRYDERLNRDERRGRRRQWEEEDDRFFPGDVR
jgi:hypothetical protein